MLSTFARLVLRYYREVCRKAPARCFFSSCILKLTGWSIMNLLFSSLFLVAGLFLCSSAPTHEECQPLVTPLSMADPSKIYGRVNVLMGYTDHDVFNHILKVTDSSWIKLSQSPLGPNEVLMTEENKMNGRCFGSSVNITIDGNTLTTAPYLPSIANITSVFHVLPSCDDCLVLSVNTTASNLAQSQESVAPGVGDQVYVD